MTFPEQPLNERRRWFLKLSGLMGLGAAAAAILPAEYAEAVLFNKQEYKVSERKVVMGTSVTITAIHHSRDRAQEAIGMAFEEMGRLEMQLTHFSPDSPIGRLNVRGSLDGIPGAVREVINHAMAYHKLTGGAFDITIKPVLDVFKKSFVKGIQPGEADISDALNKVDSTCLFFEKDKLMFKQSDMSITLDGIAKGYIVDTASAMLSKNGVKDHLINAGGDIRTECSPGKNRAWKVAIQNPYKSGWIPDILTLGSTGLATSGNYEVYFDQEKLFHHIIDVKNGRSPFTLASASAIAPTCMDADALATSIFVMGAQSGKQLVESCPGFDCFFIDRKGRVERSFGWQKYSVNRS